MQGRQGRGDGAREKVGFIENTAMRHRRGGGGEVTVTSRLTDRKTKKDKRECRYTSGGLAIRQASEPI